MQLLLLLLTLVAILSHISNSLIVQDLGGSDWIVYNQTHNNKANHLKSTVPGSIYTDLLEAKQIEDIYVEKRDVEYRWVAYSNWTFEKNFDVNKDILSKSKIYLTCHGLDTVGEVFLNGQKLGSVSNQFIRYRFPVKNLLKNKDNTIRVQFESAPLAAKRLHEESRKTYVIPPETCTPNTAPNYGECYVNMLRKMQASFSWDWGPAFPTQGIWQPIELEAYDTVTLRTISIETSKVNQTKDWLLNATVWLESEAGFETSGEVTLYLSGTKLTSNKFKVKFDANNEASVVIQTQVKNVNPWFPNGMGSQILYKLKAEVKVDSSSEATEKEVQFGFRTIELVQDLLNSTTEAYSFYFKVNGLPLFAKGSNWIPAHALHEAITEEYLEDLFRSTKEANMNMLRVWGGGVYEDERFYNLADKYGILIWQDMMFACAPYPGNEAYLRSVEVEIRQQVRRLQHHPSIAIWAGNNEVEAVMTFYKANSHWKEISHDYRQLFVRTIWDVIRREDLTRPYVTSSPSNGRFAAKENYIGDVSSNRFGDVHNYVYWGHTWDYNIYPPAKFVSEYGFQSLPSLRSLKKYLREEDLTYPISSGLEHREHQQGGIGVIQGSIGLYLPKPKTLDGFIYLSQVFQAMAIKIETERYRRNRAIDNYGNGYTMGALYWQLNQIWPGFSWSSLEYGGQWKMLHSYVKNAFENLHIDVYEEEHQVKVVIVNDNHIPANQNISIQIKIYDWSKPEVVFTKLVTDTIESFSVKQVFEAQTDALLKEAKCPNRNSCFIQVQIDSPKSENFLLLEPPNNSTGIGQAKISLKNITRLNRDEDEDFQASKANLYEIELESNQIAPFTWLELNHDSRSVFSDNGFHLIGTQKIRLWTELNESQIKSLLRVKSLGDFV